MGKRIKRWAIWKIAVGTIASFAAGGLLFWLSVLAEQATDRQEGGPSGPAPAMSLPMIVMALGMAMFIVGIIGVVLLGLRIREARTPPWERGKKKRRAGF